MDNVKNNAYYVEKILADLGFVMQHTQGKAQFAKSQTLRFKNDVLYAMYGVWCGRTSVKGICWTFIRLTWKCLYGFIG